VQESIQKRNVLLKATKKPSDDIIVIGKVVVKEPPIEKGLESAEVLSRKMTKAKLCLTPTQRKRRHTNKRIIENGMRNIKSQGN